MMDMLYIPVDFGTCSNIPRKPQRRFYRLERESNPWLSKYRYPGGVYGTYLEDFGDPVEILAWIDENIKDEIKIKNIANFYELRFKTEEALMAYKLRWL